MRPSLAGWGSPENWQFSGLREGVLGLVRYVRPEYERTQAEICGFLACLSQRLRDAVLRIVLTLVRTDDDCVLRFLVFQLIRINYRSFLRTFFYKI
jgi:hypothetical protein